jgi:signal-transduction protein with cAMP-binding, CBS, and nucleotidyltransferase domain
MNTRVQAILRSKGTDVLTINPEATVYRAIERMVDHNVGSILVMDGDEIKGIFTERDYLRRIVLQGRASKTTCIAEVMTRDVMCVDPTYDVQECMSIMTSEKCRHLPVLEDGELAGIISIGDCVKQVSRSAQARVEELKHYISGAYPV